MSAVLIDELVVDTRVIKPQLRLVSDPVEALADVRRDLEVSRSAAAARRSGLRLTSRGIAVVLSLFATLFVTGVLVVVASFLAVSDAPISVTAPAVAAAQG